ncbi:stage VI sporulation protein F [Aneurinibacillus terranovensis]|uniref:stage VI sporulation protein F n=1 Tax=Aneurinibacillus terranovensis TaxID=278991 RepID=UPI0004132DEA|nr:stage VI sporulation protein F [Aneurinibacillus terranovensis]
MDNKIPKKIIDKLQDKNVDPSKLERLAGTLKQGDLNDEQKVRQLIRQLGAIANISIDKEKEDRIFYYIKKYNIQGSNLKSLTKLLQNKL